MKKQIVYNQKKYRDFIARRDAALELIHRNSQLRMTDVLRGAFVDYLKTISLYYPSIQQNLMIVKRLEYELDLISQKALTDLVQIFTRTRRSSYILSHAGEAEALGRVIGQAKSHLTKQDLFKKQIADSKAGGSLDARINLYLKRIVRSLISGLETSALLNHDSNEALRNTYNLLPRKKRIPRRKIITRPTLKEAASDQKIVASATIIDEDEWQDILEDYVKDYVPKNRGPEDIIDIETKLVGDESEVWYAWEMERDLTHEFVTSVRDGELDAANQNGITDFVWIAIVDDKTDECCLWRDGLLTSEIADELEGEHKDDECESEVPPAHFNCRCRLAPAADHIPDLPPSNEKDFDEWLNT